MTSSSDLIQNWKARGTRLDVPGTCGTYIWREGTGPTVLCLHGVPASSFIYRKVLSSLAELSLEGVAVDFPGLGLADRPADFDYSWSGLSEWLLKAINAAAIDKFHLCVHDIGGPIGFDLIRRIPDRVLSLTILNSIMRVSKFTKPWIMRGFEVYGLGSALVTAMDSPLIIPFMRSQGVMTTPSNEELRAYGSLLVMNDGGKFYYLLHKEKTNLV